MGAFHVHIGLPYVEMKDAICQIFGVAISKIQCIVFLPVRHGQGSKAAAGAERLDMYDSLGTLRSWDEDFILTMSIPRWTDPKVALVIVDTCQGVILGYDDLPPGVKEMVAWVRVNRGIREHHQDLGDVDIEVKLKLPVQGGEEISLDVLRNRDHGQGLVKRIEGLFKAHVLAGVEQWAQKHAETRRELRDRVRMK